MKLIRVLPILFTLSVTGCTQNSEDFVSINVPVTKECVDWSLQKLNEIRGSTEVIEVSYNRFDHTLISHPEIEGFLSISSRMLDSKSDLEGYFNSVLFGCHATSSMDLEVSKLSTVVPLVDSEYKYIKVINGKAHMVFVSNQSNQSLKSGTPQSGAP